MVNKKLLILLAISSFLLIIIVIVFVNICNPLVIEEDTVILTPEMLNLLELLEDKYK